MLATKLLSFFLLFSATPSFATELARCYSFTSANLPDRSAEVAPRTERWCYQKIDGSPGSVFVFNADQDRVRAELSLVRASDGTITHGSLLAGKVTLHNVRGHKFNPFTVPLEEPSAATALAPPATEEFSQSSREVLALLLLARSPQPTSTGVAPGKFSAGAARLPWRGFWWPNKNLPMLAPLQKYDTFVQFHEGANPDSVSWETKNHKYRKIWWEGHCNGWAASSILRAEPSSPRTDSISGVTFSVSDQKGLLAEYDFCSTSVMFGRRYDGMRGQDINDIDPATFHKTLVYYIGSLRKPLGIDYHRDRVVDNHIVSGYTMEIVPTSPGWVQVTATLRVHRYDTKIVETPGMAPIYSREYKYDLELDDAGEIIGGKWISENPDFLWTPLSPARCKANNPQVREDMIQQILKL